MNSHIPINHSHNPNKSRHQDNSGMLSVLRNDSGLDKVLNELGRNYSLDSLMNSYIDNFEAKVIDKYNVFEKLTSIDFETGFFVDAERRYSTSMQSPTSGPAKSQGLVDGIAALGNDDLSRIS